MEWFLIALIVPIVWAGANIIDKIQLTRYIKDPFSYQILLFLSVIITLPIIFSLRFSISTNKIGMLIAVVFGTISGLAFIIYNKVLTYEEASRTVSLLNLGSLFILPLAIIFLNEILTVGKYIGIFLLIFGAIMVSYKFGEKGRFITKTIAYILILDFVLASASVAAKFAFSHIDILSFIFWIFFMRFFTAFGLLASSKLRRNFIKTVKTLKIKSYFLAVSNVLLALFGLLLFYYIMSQNPVSLIGAVPALQPFFALLYATIFSRFAPHVLTEGIDRKNISLKIIAVVLIFAGSYLMVA